MEDWVRLTAQSEAFGRSIMTDLSPEVHDLMTMISNGIDQRAPNALKQIDEMGQDLYKRFKEINWEQVGREIKAWEDRLKSIDLKEIAKDITAIGRGANDVAQFLGGWERAADILLTLWISGKALQAIANVVRFTQASIAGAQAMARILKGAGVTATVEHALETEGPKAAPVPAPSKLGKMGNVAGRALTVGGLAAAGAEFMQYFPHIAAWLTGQGWNDEHPTTFHDNARGLQQRLTPDMRKKQAYLAQLDQKYGLPRGLLDGMWAKESARGLNAGPSKAGALGEFQIMPDVAQAAGVDPGNFEQAAEYAARRMHDDMQQYNGSLAASLAEYNWGSSNLQKGMQQHGQDWQGYAPAETQDYIASVSRAVAAAQAAPSNTSTTTNNATTNNNVQVTVQPPKGDPQAYGQAVERVFNNPRILARLVNRGLM